MSIPSHILDQINAQADLVSIIGKHTTLKRSGKEYKGCCPFHGEKTPSFYVNPQKNIYHCFGCGVGGNAISFLRDYENLTFVEAVTELSKQTGIEIPKEDQRAVKYQRTAAAPVTHSAPSSNPSPNSASTNANTANIDSSSNSGSVHARPQDSANQPPATHLPPQSSQAADPSSMPLTSQGQSPAQTDQSGHEPFVPDYLNNYPDDYPIADERGSTYDDWASYAAASGGGFEHTYDSAPNSGFSAPHASHAPHAPSAPMNQRHSAPAQEGDLYDLLSQIQQFYERSLEQNPAAKRYFLSRGLTAQTLKTFGLGYAPQGWQHLEQAFPRDIAGLKALGLVRQSDSGRDYDLLRDRVIFPIRDNQGRVIGFAGRALDDTVKPKYINSSDSPVFHKQHVLYGYYEARQQRADDWLVVEGYMDVIALYQAGIYGAVASMGTSINEAQISRLLTMNPTLTLCFDGDSAGHKAAWRTLELSMPVLSDDKDLRFLTLPEGHDPDTFVKANGADAMREQIANATPLSQYVFAYLSERHDLSLAEGKAKLMSQVRALTNLLPKGSSFRSLLNNDIYQKLSGRRSQNKAAHDALLNFDSTLTVNFTLYLCLLYQPHLLETRPLARLWLKSEVSQLKLHSKLIDKLEQNGNQIPPLPTWSDINDEHLLTLVNTIDRLLPHLPDDTNAAAHFILANLPAPLQSLLTAQWQQFYRNMVTRGVLDVEVLFEELMIQLLYTTLKQQHRQANNYLIRGIIERRWQALMAWQQRRMAEQVEMAEPTAASDSQASSELIAKSGSLSPNASEPANNAPLTNDLPN